MLNISSSFWALWRDIKPNTMFNLQYYVLLKFEIRGIVSVIYSKLFFQYKAD